MLNVRYFRLFCRLGDLRSSWQQSQETRDDDGEDLLANVLMVAAHITYCQPKGIDARFVFLFAVKFELLFSRILRIHLNRFFRNEYSKKNYALL